jgi:hypothetical protein
LLPGGSGAVARAARTEYNRRVRWLAIASTALLAFASPRAQAAERARASIELRISPPFVRPVGAPSLCPMVAVPVADHWLVGGGYELVQDYDVSVRTSNDTSAGPMVLSGIRTGAWYRGGASRHGASMAAGGLVTFSHPSFSIVRNPKDLDRETYVIDLGLDLSFGYVWDRFRLEVFALPAWSLGRISSTADTSDQRLSGFTMRLGLGLAWVI